MAASLSPGYVFGATETVTNAKLATLVSGATLSNVDQTNLAANYGVNFVGNSAPSDTDGLWVDTSATPIVLRYYNTNASAWVPVGELALFTNRSSQTGAAGRVVILDTSNSNSYKYTSTAGDTKFLGIEGATTSNAAAGVIYTHGLGIVTSLEISASAGTYLRCSSATGKAEPCANTATGIFGFLTESGTASATANIFGIDPNNASVDQTATYTWTGSHTFNGNVTLNTASGLTTNWAPIVQMQTAMFQASATGSTTLPFDNTIPQNTEGDQFMTASITPKHAANKLIIEAVVFGSSTGNGNQTSALFQDSTANALNSVGGNTGGNANAVFIHHIRHVMTAGTTSSTTFKVRSGNNAAGTTYFNGNAFAGAGLFNGTSGSSITITEIKV